MSDNRYTILKTDHARGIRLLLWLAVLGGGLYLYFFRDEWLRQQVAGASSAPRFWLSVIYLSLSCIRGFTLVPATYLVIVGLLVLPPPLLYVLTIFGIIVSSASVYYFAEWMALDRYFERHYPRQHLELFSSRSNGPRLLRLWRAKSRSEEMPARRRHRGRGDLRHLHLPRRTNAALVYHAPRLGALARGALSLSPLDILGTTLSIVEGSKGVVAQGCARRSG